MRRIPARNRSEAGGDGSARRGVNVHGRGARAAGVATAHAVPAALATVLAGARAVVRFTAPAPVLSGGPAAALSTARAAALAIALASTVALVPGCASRTPAPEWQSSAKAATDRAVAAYLEGDTRVAEAEFERARREVARTGRADLAARVELSRCAVQVASLAFGPCTGFERLRDDAGAEERAYADYLQARSTPADTALLPEAHRNTATGAIADPLARLIATGVAFQAGRADPALIASASDTASAQGWRRPLLAWLGVQLTRAESAGARADVQRLQRRIALVQGQGQGQGQDDAAKAGAAPTSP